MDGKRAPLFLCIFLSLSSAIALPYQSFVLTSLPQPQTQALYQSDSSDLLQTLPLHDSDFELDLHHVDNLSPAQDSTAESLFKLRLRRDALRANSLSHLASSAANRGANGFSSSRAPDFSLFDTCFDLSGKTEVKVPTVVLHFAGADVSLPASNYLIPVDSDGTFCFAFAGTTSGLSIIGNIQQQGFRVVFDLAANRVGFAANSCT
ncbi:hypothetical protein SASPL_105880 [Salvia splendens]|uniref:Peptidase A1 domain-containing protein n=1 Tax=Salvia splendens TaxID=180675 RepID=A0A8X8YKS4_SALSN|nr:hypothetical protein SASPL_105880 [Salvia splendens]